MERATFIVESTAERIPCLLNPEQVVVSRTAGLRRPQAGSGPVTGFGRSDEPLLHTGGGRTEMELRLLFDTALVTDPTPVTDVRDLTSRLWNLTENQSSTAGALAGRGSGGTNTAGASAGVAGSGAGPGILGSGGLGDQSSATAVPTAGNVPLVRFLWGMEWNVLGVIDAVAEQLERFDAGGAPTRSWLFLRLVRVPDPRPTAVEPPIGGVPLGDELAAAAEAAASDPQGVHQVLGDGQPAEDGDPGAGGERLDALAAQAYGGRA
ncbi:MAG TPA: hypothetical protein VIM10_13120, partial [Actinopolymorphaceae bacterium]